MSAARQMSRRQAASVRRRTSIVSETHHRAGQPLEHIEADIAQVIDQGLAKLAAARELLGDDYDARAYACTDCLAFIIAIAPADELPDAGYPCSGCGGIHTTAQGPLAIPEHR
jgi:hypothetical protein